MIASNPVDLDCMGPDFFGIEADPGLAQEDTRRGWREGVQIEGLKDLAYVI